MYEFLISLLKIKLLLKSMAKLTMTLFNKYLSTLNEEQAKAELALLFSKVSQVKEFYAKQQGMEMPLEKAPNPKYLEEYKKKIYNQFWTRGGNPRDPSNADIRSYILAFEKMGFSSQDVIDLILYRVEKATELADMYGGMSDGCYNAAVNAFEKAIKLMQKEGLRDEYQARCERIFKYKNLDYWYIEQLKEVWQDYQ